MMFARGAHHCSRSAAALLRNRYSAQPLICHTPRSGFTVGCSRLCPQHRMSETPAGVCWRSRICCRRCIFGPISGGSLESLAPVLLPSDETVSPASTEIPPASQGLAPASLDDPLVYHGWATAPTIVIGLLLLSFTETILGMRNQAVRFEQFRYFFAALGARLVSNVKPYRHQRDAYRACLADAHFSGKF